MAITKEQFLRYEHIRISGVTNMFNVNVVGPLALLTREECFDIMKNYSTYKEKFLGENI